MVLKFVHYAGPDERFSSDAFETSIGKPFIAKVENKPVGKGQLLSANVIKEGRAVELEIEWPDDFPLEEIISNITSFSIINSNEE